jgi:hypothetical protein
MFHNGAKRLKRCKMLIISFLIECQVFEVVEFLHTLGGMTTNFADIFH